MSPKSAAASESGSSSMDEMKKALEELVNKQQGHEDPEKDPKLAFEWSASSMDIKLAKAIAELELCYEQSEDPEKLICSAKKALDMFLRHQKDCYASGPLGHERSLSIACVLNILGYTCLDLKKFDESLKYLNWSNRKLNELLEDGGGSSSPEVLECLIQTHVGLFKIKMAMGRKEDAPRHMKKVLEFKEKTMEEGCLGLGQAYKDLYKVYLELFDCEQVLPYCLKALDIYTQHMGEESVEVALIRKDLGVVYGGLGEYDLALEQNMLAISALESDGGQELLMAELQKGFILIQLRRYKEAVGALKDVVSCGEEKLGVGGRVLAFTAMALALCGQQKSGEAKKYMETTREILDKEAVPSLAVASALGDLSALYEKIEDFKTSMYLLMKVLKTPELPKKVFLKNYKRFFDLVPKAGNKVEAFPYLEDAVEKLKQSFGPKHSEVGYAYCNLATACENLQRLHEAVKYYENGKEIMDASLGPRHTDSLKASQTLSMTYARAGRYDLAISCQEKVVEGMIAAGPSEEKNLAEAVVLLRGLQSGCPMVYFPKC